MTSDFVLASKKHSAVGFVEDFVYTKDLKEFLRLLKEDIKKEQDKLSNVRSDWAAFVITELQIVLDEIIEKRAGNL